MAEVSGDNITYTTTINEPGEKIFTLAYGNGKQTSVECLAVSNFDSLVNHRCQFIAGHQQFIKPGDPRSGAFIVYDNDTESLYINGESGSKRSDCDEARERVAMGILLALQYQRTSDKKLMDALNNYVSFIRRIPETGLHNQFHRRLQEQEPGIQLSVGGRFLVYHVPHHRQ